MKRFGYWLIDLLETEITFAHALGWFIGIKLSEAFL